MAEDLGFDTPAGTRNFFLLHSAQTISGAHPAFYILVEWAPGALSTGVKLPGCEADNSTPSNAEIKNGGAILHSPIRFYGGCLIN
jgi:hypothetical protein